eukprot:GILJ01003067.1.p1 GENE.GILJ01003067.1~~GILJ01003067.1.p1  ORF type:complete len:442 (-),score=116.72 GILJ01003067.1:168-1493(-)
MTRLDGETRKEKLQNTIFERLCQVFGNGPSTTVLLRSEVKDFCKDKQKLSVTDLDVLEQKIRAKLTIRSSSPTKLPRLSPSPSPDRRYIAEMVALKQNDPWVQLLESEKAKAKEEERQRQEKEREKKRLLVQMLAEQKAARDRAKQREMEEEQRYQEQLQRDMNRWKQEERTKMDKLKTLKEDIVCTIREQADTAKRIKQKEKLKLKHDAKLMINKISEETEAEEREILKKKMEEYKRGKALMKENEIVRKQKIEEQRQQKLFELQQEEEYARHVQKVEQEREERLRAFQEKQQTLQRKVIESMPSVDKAKIDEQRALMYQQQKAEEARMKEIQKAEKALQLKRDMQNALKQQLLEAERRKEKEQQDRREQAHWFKQEEQKLEQRERAAEERRRILNLQQSIELRKQIDEVEREKVSRAVTGEISEALRQYNKSLLTASYR